MQISNFVKSSRFILIIFYWEISCIAKKSKKINWILQDYLLLNIPICDQVGDLGAILPQGEFSKNYTLEDYFINEWYYSWLPHTNQRQDGITTFQVSSGNFCLTR